MKNFGSINFDNVHILLAIVAKKSSVQLEMQWELSLAIVARHATYQESLQWLMTETNDKGKSKGQVPWKIIHQNDLINGTNC